MSLCQPLGVSLQRLGSHPVLKHKHKMYTHDPHMLCHCVCAFYHHHHHLLLSFLQLPGWCVGGRVPGRPGSADISRECDMRARTHTQMHTWSNRKTVVQRSGPGKFKWPVVMEPERRRERNKTKFNFHHKFSQLSIKPAGSDVKLL